jgi:hypothetical protein
MKRFAHALSHELTLQYRNILIAAGAAAGAMMLVSMVTWVGGIEPVDLWPGYQAAMLIIGVLITSGEFGELRSPGHRIAFLLRPSTVWEKVATKILVSTLFVWVSVTLAFLLVSLLSSVIYLVVAGGERAAWALGIAFAGGEWPRIAWETLRVYLPIHAVFFFGSVYFRKHPAGTYPPCRCRLGDLLRRRRSDHDASRLPPVHRRKLSRQWPHPRDGHRVLPGGGAQPQPRHLERDPPVVRPEPGTHAPILSVTVVAAFWLLAVLRLRETEA